MIGFMGKQVAISYFLLLPTNIPLQKLELGVKGFIL